MVSLSEFVERRAMVRRWMHPKYKLDRRNGVPPRCMQTVAPAQVTYGLLAVSAPDIQVEWTLLGLLQYRGFGSLKVLARGTQKDGYSIDALCKIQMSSNSTRQQGSKVTFCFACKALLASVGGLVVLLLTLQ